MKPKAKHDVTKIYPLFQDLYDRDPDLFSSYYHVILEDKNHEDGFCDGLLEMWDPAEGEEVLKTILIMKELSQSQRIKLSRMMKW